MKKKPLVFLLITIVIAVALGLLIRGFYLYQLATKDPYEGLYTLDKTEDTFLKTVLKGAAFGREFTVTEAEFNTFINQKYCNQEHDGITLKHIRFYFHQNQPAKVYLQAEKYGVTFAVKCSAEISVDSENIMSIRFFDAYVGELAVGDDVIERTLQKFTAKYDFLHIRDHTCLYLEAAYTYQGTSFSFEMKLRQLQPVDGGLQCRTNSLTAQAFKALWEYVRSDEGQRILGDLLEVIRERWRQSGWLNFNSFAFAM